VIFTAPCELSKPLPDLITAQIKIRLGHKVPVMLRTLAEMRAVVRSNPFLKEQTSEDILHVMFLGALPKPGAVQNLDPDRSPPNQFVLRGKEVYLRFPDGFARNKLTSSYFDSKLGTIGTIRTWRTVIKLLELMTQVNFG
jgi:uncharacterized protein (DUF1697 family)